MQRLTIAVGHFAGWNVNPTPFGVWFWKRYGPHPHYRLARNPLHAFRIVTGRA